MPRAERQSDGEPGFPLVRHDRPAFYQKTSPLSIVDVPGKGRALVTNRDLAQGERILAFCGERVTRRRLMHPNAALQIDEDLFLESNGTIDECLNHSCRPNCYIDFKHLTLAALRGIGRGEELTFNYNTSEYDLIDQGCAFVCNCGSETCVGHIAGFKHAPPGHRKSIQPILAPYLRRKMQEEIASDDKRGCKTTKEGVQQ